MTNKTHKHILLNAFDMNSVGHINHGLWTHPRDQSHRFNELSYWTELAQTLERGLFDGLFIADITGVYDVYQNNIDLTLRESIQLPSHDPTTLVSAMAAVTQHLGFGVTVNLSYETPYQFARRFASLDHLTQGRIGWNIVTGYLDSAERLIGQSALKDHDLRYDQAEEFLALCYKYWEGSWESDALLKDKQHRVLQIHTRYIRFIILGGFIKVKVYFKLHLRCSARQCCFKQAPLQEEWPLQLPMPNAFLLVAINPTRSNKMSIKFVSAPNSMGAIQTISRFLSALPWSLPKQQLKHKINWRSIVAMLPEAGIAHYASSVGIDLSKYADHEVVPYQKVTASLR